jgi:hypothetical protein
MAFAFLGIGAGGHKGGVQELASVCHPTIGSVLSERKTKLHLDFHNIFFCVTLCILLRYPLARTRWTGYDGWRLIFEYMGALSRFAGIEKLFLRLIY